MKYATIAALVLAASATFAQVNEIKVHPSTDYHRRAELITQIVELVPGNDTCGELHFIKVPPGGWSKVSIGATSFRSGIRWAIQTGLNECEITYMDYDPRGGVDGLWNVVGDRLVFDSSGWVHLVWKK